jgi:microcystin-dependent protein
MSAVSAFAAELRLFSFNFAPKGWALCNGQLMPINQNQALFSLLGTTYGGNGQTTFALPNLRGRVPIHIGQGFTQGQAAGEEAHTLSQSEMPAHTHFLSASSANADNINPGNNMFASFNAGYAPPNNLVALAPATITNTGGSQAHENRQPYTVLSYGICLTGIFPSRN